MTTHKLLEAFYNNHEELIGYVDALTAEEYNYRHDDKWTAGQQLTHVYLCLLPFLKILASKEVIAQKFGTADRPTWDYDEVIARYLKTSRRAPERFEPGPVPFEGKAKLVADFHAILPAIQQLLRTFTDDELDSLVLPHPLLGNLTIREMFFLMTYHATHHLRQVHATLER
jgi:uncharacterized damage-inducible protein DinB